MPRIAAAIGVFATIAICIFINIKRYPAVWDMVGSSPWFAQDKNAAPQDPSPQPTEIAETETAEKPVPALQPITKKHTYKPLPSLKPQLANQPNPSTDLHVDSFTSKSPDDIQNANANRAQASGAPMKQIPTYQGLNPGPIRVPDSMQEVPDTLTKTLVSDDAMPKKSQSQSQANRSNMQNNVQRPLPQTVTSQGPTPPPTTIQPGGTDKNWPAEMSPRMKYAAKPPLLESYQQWNPERPVVPVARPKENDAKKDGAQPAKPKTKPAPASKDSSAIEPAKQSDTFTKNTSVKSDNKEVVQHLPAVDPHQRPIRMSIPGSYPAKPIPVYPDTGR